MFIEYFMIVITSILIVLPFVLTYLYNKHKVVIERPHISGYELCDGSKLQLDKYPLLKKYFEENKISRWKIMYYKLLKLLGINTFKLPDLRDQFIKPSNSDNGNL